jgi:hypothetical protein
MSYKETPEEIASEEDHDENGTTDTLDPNEELEFEEGDNSITIENLEDVDDLGGKSSNKTKPTFSLKARRAIEDHLEKRRLRKELDYLDDDIDTKDT